MSSHKPSPPPSGDTRPDPTRKPRGAALVTGAARRLGREIALGLAGAGWDIAVHYGNSADDAQATVADIEALGRRAIAVQADLADEAQACGMFDRAVAKIGPIRCLVNSASRFEFDRPESFDYRTLLEHVGPNLAAPLLLARKLHASLADGDQGVVINLLDQKLENLNPDFFSYTLTKAALLAATRIMAQAFAPRLRVAAVSPGITLISGDQSEAGFRRAHRMTPLGRSSTPEDIVAAVLYLAHARAVTGVNLAVDGGQHLLPLSRDVMYLTGASPAGPQDPGTSS
jgi:NAD(P)-dependent dehydrogenase (short-subunit alcohol dehydrogenase family)